MNLFRLLPKKRKTIFESIKSLSRGVRIPRTDKQTVLSVFNDFSDPADSGRNDRNAGLQAFIDNRGRIFHAQGRNNAGVTSFQQDLKGLDRNKAVIRNTPVLAGALC